MFLSDPLTSCLSVCLSTSFFPHVSYVSPCLALSPFISVIPHISLSLSLSFSLGLSLYLFQSPHDSLLYLSLYLFESIPVSFFPLSFAPCVSLSLFLFPSLCLTPLYPSLPLPVFLSHVSLFLDLFSSVLSPVSHTCSFPYLSCSSLFRSLSFPIFLSLSFSGFFSGCY